MRRLVCLPYFLIKDIKWVLWARNITGAANGPYNPPAAGGDQTSSKSKKSIKTAAIKSETGTEKTVPNKTTAKKTAIATGTRNKASEIS